MKMIKYVSIFIVSFSIALILAAVINGTIASELSGRETPLNPDGYVYELFHDSQGELWSSDYLVDEIWRVNPTSGDYTIYSNLTEESDPLTGASDGRVDDSGNLWWANFYGHSLGRLVLGASQATVWTLAADASPLGTAFGDSGQIWATDAFEPNLYHFTPSSSQLCIYAMPDDGTSDYILFQSGQIWLGDPTLGRILRLDTGSGTFTIWPLATDAYPQGMALDSSGKLWWADAGLGYLGQLDPQSNKITTFTIPTLGGPLAEPEAVAVNGDGIWYTNNVGSAGRLDPVQASGSTSTVPPTTTTVSPACSNIGAGTAVAIGEQSGILSWANESYSVAQDSAGWLIYELPSGAAPWGLAVSGDNVWFNDQGTVATRSQQLGWIAYSQVISLPAGWNMISSYVEAPNPSLEDVFNPIIDDVILVKNDAGGVFWPDLSINTIGDWDVKDGYQVYMSAGTTRDMVGSQVDPTTPIDTPAGWSIVAYLRDTPMDAEQAMDSLSGELVLAKNNAGEVYWPAYSINQIGDMQPGEGYQIYLSAAGTLTYPPND